MPLETNMIERKTEGHERGKSSLYIDDTVICDLSSVATSAVSVRHNYPLTGQLLTPVI